MKREAGFTLVEIMVVIAMIGILVVTSVPVYRTYQQRAYGSEASIMMKKLVDGQIIYYLDNNRFFPAVGQTIIIPPDDPPTAQASQNIQDVLNALKISIPLGHHLEYSLTNYGSDCYMIISAPFAIFKDGHKQYHCRLDNSGKAYLFSAG